MAKKTRYYVGPHAAVETIVNRRAVAVNYGESIDVDDELAASMDAQPDIWSSQKPTKKDGPAPSAPADESAETGEEDA